MNPSDGIAQTTQIWGLAALAAGLFAAVWLTRHLHPRKRGVLSGVLALVAVYGLSFQVFHGIEHAVQFGQWMIHPLRPPWMSHWAMQGRDSIASLTGRSMSTSNELLHLVGNVIFLAGLIATGRVMFAGRRRPGAWRRARRFQTIHVVEHIALAATSLTLGRSVGVTTLFGLLDLTTPTGVAVRVVSHFALNAVPTTLCAIVAVRELRRPDGGDEAVAERDAPDDSVHSVPDATTRERSRTAADGHGS